MDRNTDTKTANEVGETANEVGAVHREQKFYSNRRKQLPTIPKKRVNLRPTEASILLQNKIKDNRNARYYEQVIRRVAKSREVEQGAISRIAESREDEYTNFERVQSKIREFGEKISGAFARVREKTLTKLNEVKEKLSFGKLKKDDNLEKLVKNMEASTQDKSVSSSLNKIKEVQKPLQNNDLKSYFAEKLSAKFDEVDKKSELEVSNEAPAKKQSKERER